jgi:hypothetical protein
LPVGRDLLATVLPGVAAFVRDWVPEIADADTAAEVLFGQMFLGFIRHMFDPALEPAAIAADATATLVRALLG